MNVNIYLINYKILIQVNNIFSNIQNWFSRILSSSKIREIPIIGLIGIIIGFISIIPVIYFIIERNYQGMIDVEFSEKSVFIVPVYGMNSMDKEIDGSLGIGFPELRIINNTNHNITIKELNLRYEVDNKVFFSNLYKLPQNTEDRCGIEEEGIMLTNIHNRGLYIFCDWEKERLKLRDYKTILQGGILSGSVFYKFEYLKRKDYNKLKNLCFVIKDSEDKSYEHELILRSSYIETADKGYAYIYLR